MSRLYEIMDGSQFAYETSYFANMRQSWKLGDWQRVRFSDEVHCGRGPQRQLVIIRRPGERYCFDCIQEERQPATEERAVSWAASNFQSRPNQEMRHSSNSAVNHDHLSTFGPHFWFCPSHDLNHRLLQARSHLLTPTMAWWRAREWS